MHETVRRTLRLAKGILAALGGPDGRSPTSQIVPGVEPVVADKAAA